MIKIYNWGELSELELSLTHYLNINLEYGFGRLINKDGTKEKYLSTHTFYGYGVMEYISKKLQSCRFDVELIGWDKEINKVLLLNSCGYGLDKECYTWNSCIRNIKRFTRYIKSGVGLI